MTTATTTTRPVVEFFARTSETGEKAEAGLRRAPTIRSKTMPATARHSRPRSPTDSASSSSDEDLDDARAVPMSARGRSLDKELEQKLHEAVSSIKLTRSMSPELGPRARASVPDIPSVVVVNPSNTASPDQEVPRPMHTKSASLHDLSIVIHPSQASEESSCAVLEDDTSHCRPHRMVRKKSGELVRSSLKLGAKGRRPASMPSTPGYSKNVHFDRKLEHVRHFLYTERPAAVSANTSPTQEYSTNGDFPFRNASSLPSDDHELTIELPNFIPESQQTDNEGAIIKVETVYLSTDRKSLIGRVAVRNLAFQKYVGVRYTLDHWKTTSETAAEYTEDVRKRHRDDAFDRFCFNIKIDAFNGVTEKTMFFCVRYNTAGQDYWDSNAGQNFRVEFHMRRSGGRRAMGPPIMAPVRRSSVDDIVTRTDDIDLLRNHDSMTSSKALIFENIYDSTSGPILEDQDHEKPIRVKSIGKSGATADCFSNRYDFGASLSAAIAAANSMLQGTGDEIKLRHDNRSESTEHAYNPYFSATADNIKTTGKFSTGTASPTFPPALDSSTCNTPASSGEVSPVPGLSARSPAQNDKAQAYQSLLDNYCFFQPNKPRSSPFLQSFRPSSVETSTSPSDATSENTPTTRSPNHSHHGSPVCGKQMLKEIPKSPHQEFSTSGIQTPIRI